MKAGLTAAEHFSRNKRRRGRSHVALGGWIFAGERRSDGAKKIDIDEWNTDLDGVAHARPIGVAEELIALRRKLGLAGPALWAPAFGTANEVIWEIDFPDLATFERENEAFYSDADESFEFERYRADVSREVEAWFQAEARRRLPPSQGAEPGPEQTAAFQWHGAFEDDFNVRDLGASSPPLFSRCGKGKNLQIRTQLDVDNHANPTGQGVVAIDSVDGEVYHLVWQSCSGK